MSNTVPSITTIIAKAQWEFIYPRTIIDTTMIEAATANKLYPLTILAAHRMPKFIACAIIPYHEVLLGESEDGLATSWFNTTFAPNFTDSTAFEFKETFTEEDAEKMSTDLQMLAGALKLIQIVFPALFQYELKEEVGLVHYSAKALKN